MLSSRLPKELNPTRFFVELENAKNICKKYNDFIDMTISSPLKIGLPFNLQKALTKNTQNFNTWVTAPQGSLETRKTICNYYKERGADFNPEQILLTSSTSEAYSILFKIFCDPQDIILTPCPGYPLLDTLAQLEHLKCYPYFLNLSYKQNNDENHIFRFTIDTNSLLSAPEKSKILLLVSPHNPTGHCVSQKEWKEIILFCEQHKLVLVVDEVFGDYPLQTSVHRSWEYLKNNPNPKCPIFWLNGLSKTVGSPQIKLGWMAFYIPEKNFETIHTALEFVADAYLSVSTPAQLLGIPMLKESKDYEESIKKRLCQNWKTLKNNFSYKYCPDVLAGWYAAIRLKEDDEISTLKLLRKKHILVQPGFFFDFNEDNWIVISLLQEPSVFAEGIARIKSLDFV